MEQQENQGQECLECKEKFNRELARIFRTLDAELFCTPECQRRFEKRNPKVEGIVVNADSERHSSKALR